MLKVGDAKSVGDYLMNSDYASTLERTSTELPGAARLSRAFYAMLVSRCYRLVDIAPGGTRRFLEAYLERFLVEDMKRILRAKHGGSRGKAQLVEIPEGYDYASLQVMSGAPTLQDAVKSLEETRFRGVADAMAEYQKHNLVSILEAALDKIYFDLELRPSLVGLPRSCGVDEMVGTEEDLVNIGTISDLRSRGVPPEVVRTISLLPFGLSADQIERLSDANLESIPRILARTPYAALAQPVQAALDATSEESLDQVVRVEARRLTKPLMFRFALSLGYVLGYISDAEREAENLVAIASGKELGLADSKIETTLCL